jgi:hypothetical protein
LLVANELDRTLKNEFLAVNAQNSRMGRPRLDPESEVLGIGYQILMVGVVTRKALESSRDAEKITQQHPMRN